MTVAAAAAATAATATATERARAATALVRSTDGTSRRSATARSGGRGGGDPTTPQVVERPLESTTTTAWGRRGWRACARARPGCVHVLRRSRLRWRPRRVGGLRTARPSTTGTLHVHTYTHAHSHVCHAQHAQHVHVHVHAHVHVHTRAQRLYAYYGSTCDRHHELARLSQGWAAEEWATLDSCGNSVAHVAALRGAARCLRLAYGLGFVAAGTRNAAGWTALQEAYPT